MNARTFQGTVKGIEVVHRKNITTDAGRRRYARIVVWATTNAGKRVWVRTVEGGLDPLFIGIKVAMTQEFFSKLVGCKIHFHKDKYDEEADTFFTEEASLPKRFLASYQEIKRATWKWVKAHYAEELKRFQAEKSAKAAATKAENAADRRKAASALGLPKNATQQMIRQARSVTWQKIHRAEEAERLERRRENALHLAFTRGYNPKRASEQWEARHGGRLFVLRREDVYDRSEGTVPIEVMFDLVPDRILLARRI